MQSGIYKITNTINNKVYVGSAANFENRWKRHFIDLERNTHCNIILQRSYNKHGKDVFKCEVIEYVEYTKPIIVNREDYWINTLDSKNNGYNIADASFGDTITNHPNREEILLKISNALKVNNSKLSKEELKDKHGTINKLKGKTLKDVYGEEKATEISKKMSESNYNRKMEGEGNPFYGKTHTKETRLKLSESQKGVKRPWKSVMISGNIYKNLAEAIKATNKTRNMLVSLCNDPDNKDYRFC